MTTQKSKPTAAPAAKPLRATPAPRKVAPPGPKSPARSAGQIAGVQVPAQKKKTKKELAAEQPDALAKMAVVASQPHLDELFKRNPTTHTLDDRRYMIEHMRKERALWVLKQDKKEAKAEGVAATGAVDG